MARSGSYAFGESSRGGGIKTFFTSCMTLSTEVDVDEHRRLRRCDYRMYCGLNGLQNCENNCFMNSAVQCLSNTALFLDFILDNRYFKEIQHGHLTKGDVMLALGDVIKGIWSSQSNERVITLVELKREVEKFAPFYIGYGQQDAQEFLRYLLQALHDDINRGERARRYSVNEMDESLTDKEKAEIHWSNYVQTNNSMIIDLFCGQLKSVLKCCKCKHRSVTFEVFWDLSLPIPQRTGKITLTQCLKMLTKRELFKANCVKCDKERKFSRRYSIVRFPKVLTVHLKRFTSTVTTLKSKISTCVDYPITDWNLTKFGDKTGDYFYDLYGVCYHNGFVHSGHYNAYCRHPFTAIWHNFDDAEVSPVPENCIVNNEAYILFYELNEEKSNFNNN